MQWRSGGRDLGAVLFTDIVGSTEITAEMGNTRWSELVARHHRIVRGVIGRFGGHEVDTAGDGFFVSFERPADAIRAAVAATDAVRELGIEIRASVGFGELETVSGKPGGLVVNAAARVMAVAGTGEVLVPASVRELVLGAGFTFSDHGAHHLKGVEGEFHLFKVTGVDGETLHEPLEVEQAAERRREIFPGRRRRGALIAGIVASVLAVTAGTWVFLSGESAHEPEISRPLQHAVARVSPETGSVGVGVTVGLSTNPSLSGFIEHPIAAGEGGVWVIRPPLLLHIDPRHEEVRGPGVEVGFFTSQSVATGFGSVWVLTDETLYRVHPGTDGSEPFLVLPSASGLATYHLAVGGAVWVGTSGGTLIRLDPYTGARNQEEFGLSVDAIAATRGRVWIADVLAGLLIQVDPESLQQRGDAIELAGNIDQMVGDSDDVWVLDKQVGTVTRIDAASHAVKSTRVGNYATDMAIGLGAVWIADRGGSLYRVDSLTLDVKEFPIGAQVLGVAVDEAAEEVWIYAGYPYPVDPAG